MTLFYGFIRGLAVCFESIEGIVCLILSLGIGAAVFFVLLNSVKLNSTKLNNTILDSISLNDTPMDSTHQKLNSQTVGVYVWGLLLMCAPLAPYFIVANPWFSLRATVASFAGAGLIFDALLRLILRRCRIYSIVCALLALVCVIAGISEVHDYHEMGEYDNRIAAAIIESKDKLSGRVGILGLEEFPIDEQNYSYHEHIQSAASSDWSLYGKLVAVYGSELDFTPVPLATRGFSFYREWNRDMKRISGFDQLWLWDDETMSLIPLEKIPQESGEHDFEITYSDGTPWGYVFEEGEYGYIEIYE